MKRQRNHQKEKDIKQPPPNITDKYDIIPSILTFVIDLFQACDFLNILFQFILSF
jgi:hypothetical protein